MFTVYRDGVFLRPGWWVGGRYSHEPLRLKFIVVLSSYCKYYNYDE